MAASEKDGWVSLLPDGAVEAGAVRSLKVGSRHLLVAMTAEGPSVLDGRCPHEGYPLATGTLKDCVLTCSWHNWKFDVRDGSCLLGGEGVRVYPTRVRDGRIEADLRDPDPEARWPGLVERIEDAAVADDLDRAVREMVRLLDLGYDPHALLQDLAAIDGRRAEWGSSHALPVAADCGRLLGGARGADAARPIAPALELLCDEVARLPEHPASAPIPGGDERAFRAAVEAEDLARAEGLLAGALDRGAPRREVDAWLYGALSDHFLSFGHPLIYLVKAQELLGRVDPGGRARDVYRGLVRRVVLSTREDTLPYMAVYRRFVEDRAAALSDLDRREGGGGPFDPRSVIEAVLDGTPPEACEAVWRALEGGARVSDVACALVACGAERLLRFDAALDRDPLVAEAWLWATHRLTFASAVRNAVLRHRGPDRLRFLFQAVAFVNSGRAMDLPDPPRSPQPAREFDESGFRAAIARRDEEAALSRARAGWSDPRARPILLDALAHAAFETDLVRPIYVAHAIKTAVAAIEEAEAEGAVDPERVVLAAARFLASPVLERKLDQLVETSIRFVVGGEMPRKLTQ